MLSERQLEALLEHFNARMQAVTDEYLRRMGEHLRDIGALKPSDIHILTEMKRVGANAEEIMKALARAADISVRELAQAFEKIAESDEGFMRAWFQSGFKPVVKGPAQRSVVIERILKAQLRVTAQEFKNLSQTTILTDSYRKAVDAAVQAVQAGMTDYNSAIRSAMKQAARDGLRVQYPNSGLTRRLDTAVRQNVLDGVRALDHDILQQIGNELGADGVEISAHALCAEDHLPYQGRQFSHREFERIQNMLARPFGMWNCKHTIMPIILGVSEPAYSEEELEAFKRNSLEEIEIDGRKMSRYEWTQEQRRIETAVRYQKDIAVAAKASGDMPLRREAQAKINALDERYRMISEKAGLSEQRERMAVSGFRRVKAENELKNIQKSGTMNTARRILVDGEPIKPISKNRLQKIVKAFARKGGSIQMGTNIDSYLESKRVQAITYDYDVIFLHSNPSRAAVFEELIHSAQYRDGKIDATERSKVLCEIEAKEKLLKYARAYRLTAAEIRETQKLLKKDREDLKRISGGDVV